MAGSTTKTVQGTYWMNGFPTNGQAKELPIATWERLWRDAPRTYPALCQTRPATPFPGNKTSDMPPPVLWDL